MARRNDGMVTRHGFALHGRRAECWCGMSEPSHAHMQFFVYRGPGSHWAENVCKHCNQHRDNHQHTPCWKCSWRPEPGTDGAGNTCNLCLGLGRRITPMDRGKCPGWEPAGDQPDEYYCGHSGELGNPWKQ